MRLGAEPDRRVARTIFSVEVNPAIVADVGAHLDLSSDQELFVETTRRFLEAHAGAESARRLREDDHGFGAEYWRRGCDLGWTSLVVSEAHGGGSVSGDEIADLALVAYEFGRSAASGPLLSTNAVAAAISRFGSDDQRRLLPGLIAGETVATWALAEPRPHDGLADVAMQATTQDDGWTLNGTKVQVESAADAAYLLVSARSDVGPTQFLVAADSRGLECRPMRSVDLSRRFAEVTFDGVWVGPDAVVGGVGGAGPEIERQLQLVNVMQAAEMVGALDRAMDITLEWLLDRYTFGRPLGSYQAIKHRLADMKTWLEASRALADGAVAAVQAGADDADQACSAAKAYIGHYGPELCQECVQFHGGIGVTFEHDLHVYLRRVVLDATTYGTVAQHRMRLTDIAEIRDREDAA
jgi:alkylation response protein AidB-like acyl-CoA dehydrogenase